MLPVIQHRVGKVFATLTALAAWLASGGLFDSTDRLQRIGWYLAGGLIFFILAVLLPEYPKLRFLSRQSALRLTAFLILLAAVEWGMHVQAPADYPHRLEINLAVGVGAIVLPFLFYFATFFMIRGFRAAPQYPVEEADKAVPVEAEVIAENTGGVSGDVPVPSPEPASRSEDRGTELP